MTNGGYPLRLALFNGMMLAAWIGACLLPVSIIPASEFTVRISMAAGIFCLWTIGSIWLMFRDGKIS